MTVRNFEISGWEAGVSGAYERQHVTDNNVSQTENAVAIYADNYVVMPKHLDEQHIRRLHKSKRHNFVCQNQIANNYGGIMIYATLKPQ